MDAWKTELWTTERIYGPGAAMRLRMDRALLAQAQRAPGLASSFAGLDTFLGRDYTIGFEDFLGSTFAPLTPPRAAPSASSATLTSRASRSSSSSSRAAPELSPLAPRVSVHEAFERKLGR